MTNNQSTYYLALPYTEDEDIIFNTAKTQIHILMKNETHHNILKTLKQFQDSLPTLLNDIKAIKQDMMREVTLYETRNPIEWSVYKNLEEYAKKNKT